MPALQRALQRVTPAIARVCSTTAIAVGSWDCPRSAASTNLLSEDYTGKRVSVRFLAERSSAAFQQRAQILCRNAARGRVPTPFNRGCRGHNLTPDNQAPAPARIDIASPTRCAAHDLPTRLPQATS